MVDTDTSTEIVLSQLSLIVNNNLEQAGSLEEALVSNNEGLPFDMYLDTRSKKTNNSKMDISSGSQLPNVINDQTMSSTGTLSSNSVNSKEKMDLFCKTPHFVMCQTPNGAMSCFVTIPPPTDSSTASLFPPGAKLPLPSLSHSLQMDLKTPQRLGNSSKTKRSTKKNLDNQQKFSHSKVSDILSNMLPSTKQLDCKKLSISTSTEVMDSNKSDYDADTFSDFARRLSADGVSAEFEQSISDIDESQKSKDVIGTNSDQQNLLATGSNIPQSLVLQQPFHSSTSNFCNDFQNCDILNIDLGDKNVEQLLRLSPGLCVNESTNDLQHPSHFEPPLSPLTKLMNSLTAPSNETSVENVSSNFQTHSEACNIWDNSTSNLPLPIDNQQSSSSIDPSLNFTTNQHTSFQIPTDFPSPINSLSLNKNSDMMHNMLQQPENHLLMDTSSIQRFYPSDTLYSFPNTTGDANSFSEFSGSLLPAHEYQDLESLMNTVITSNSTENSHQASVNCTQPETISDSVFSAQGTHLLADKRLYALDTNSVTSLALSDVSSQDLGPPHHFSLPDLTLEDHDSQQTNTEQQQANTENAAIWSQFFSDHAQAPTQSVSARSSSCLSSISGLQDIPEGLQMDLEEVPFMHQLNVCDYRTGVSSVPSSPGQASVSSHSSLSANDVFDGGSPSVLELCEMLSESTNVQKHDFSHLTLSGM